MVRQSSGSHWTVIKYLSGNIAYNFQGQDFIFSYWINFEFNNALLSQKPLTSKSPYWATVHPWWRHLWKGPNLTHCIQTCAYSRVWNKHTPTLINFLTFFQGLQPYFGFHRAYFGSICIRYKWGYAYSFCQNFQWLRLFQTLEYSQTSCKMKKMSLLNRTLCCKGSPSWWLWIYKNSYSDHEWLQIDSFPGWFCASSGATYRCSRGVCVTFLTSANVQATAAAAANAAAAAANAAAAVQCC